MFAQTEAEMRMVGGLLVGGMSTMAVIHSPAKGF